MLGRFLLTVKHWIVNTVWKNKNTVTNPAIITDCKCIVTISATNVTTATNYSAHKVSVISHEENNNSIFFYSNKH